MMLDKTDLYPTIYCEGLNRVPKNQRYDLKDDKYLYKIPDDIPYHVTYVRIRRTDTLGPA